LSTDTTLAVAQPNRREIFAWVMYDWANSAYSTLSITVLVSYLQAILPGETGVRAWGWGIGVTNLLVAILSPVLGAVADGRATKRLWLTGTALTGAIASALMFFATPDRAWLLVVLFLIAQLGMELAQGFYNGFLPELAGEKRMDRLSAQGFAVGYVGGGLSLLLFLLLFSLGTHIGLPSSDADPTSLLPRLGLLLMGVWWAVFTLPAVFWLRDRGKPKHDLSVAASALKALREVKKTITNLKRYRMLFLFLLGFLFYNDGAQTVLSQASVFGKQELGMTAGELVQVVLMIQFVALPGALGIGYLSERLGAKVALVLCLAVWVALLVGAYFVSTKAEFWVLGGGVALVMGGIQSVSRSIMGKMTPVAHTAEFFGFFNLSSKAASMFGPVVFSEVLTRTHDAHNAILSLLLFFVVGWVIVSFVNVEAGRKQAVAEDAATK
jgi:UMF1 family MFS transporter